MHNVFNELTFWLIFLVLNSMNFVINYIVHFKKSYFLPYISEWTKFKKSGLIISANQDCFRYSVEISIILIISRFKDLSNLEIPITILFLFILIFNTHQYLLRALYHQEPDLINELKLLKTGLAIVWKDSRIYLFIGIIGAFLLSLITFSLVKWFIPFSFSLKPNTIFVTIATIWSVPLLRSIQKFGFHFPYPSDIKLRYHFTMVEFALNIYRSYNNYRLASSELGKKIHEARSVILVENPISTPNIHFLFIESYGSYYFQGENKHVAFSNYRNFLANMSSQNWVTLSTYSKSPTTGGQSWLAYSSFLYGINMPNQSYYQNLLYDKCAHSSNNLLRLFRRLGYTNYNLNPINPILGVNIPYDQMREFYAIDRWILNDKLDYKGDVYGFGASPPDQYSLNKCIDIIRKSNEEPYTLFFLTQNSHSPFFDPEIKDDWKQLNNVEYKSRVHNTFLKQPKQDQYIKSINYQLKVIDHFIRNQGKDSDIFLIIGDHQPPVLANTEEHGVATPVHIIAKDKRFLDGFKAYGFQEELENSSTTITHQSLYSIFLREYIRVYGGPNSIPPDYEPNGLEI